VRYDREGLNGLLREAREARATDIHLKCPSRPRFRIEGTLVQSPHPTLRPGDTLRLVQAVLDLAGREVPLAAVSDLQVGFGLHKEGRFRAHIYRQRGSLGMVIHRMALTPPRLGEIGAPADLASKVWGHGGLVLVTGRADRLQTLAALADAYNHLKAGSLFMIEEPLEYLHKDARAVMSQREVGVDVPSVAEGLQSALRADCDALVATDIPDAASAEAILRIAEDGRSVAAGLAGATPAAAAAMMARRFSSERRDEVEDRINRCLLGVLHRDGDRLVLHRHEKRGT
jgi:twitching motility protein PilT